VSGNQVHLRIITIAIATVAIGTLTGNVAAQGTAQADTAGAGHALDDFIVRRMDEAGIMGLGAAIVVKKKVVWKKGYGFADKQRAVPFSSDTVMNIGSISKTFTGVALMRAVQDGKLSLDEDINVYLPFRVINPNYPKDKITLRQLATHTSGITDRMSVYKDTYHFGGDAPEPLVEFLKNYFVPEGVHYSKDNFLNVRPGKHREYSNIAAGLAGYIVEVAVGEKLNIYTKQRIFTPLRMDNTGWFLSEIAPGKHSKLYVAQNGLTIPIPLYELTTYPDGGVRTSVADLAKLFIALLNDGSYEGTRILDKRSVDEMLRFHYTNSNKPDNVILEEKNSGLFWQSKYNVTRIGHGGLDPGLMTDMLSNLSKDVGVILFINTSLSEEGMRDFSAIFLEIWKHAEALKKEQLQGQDG
jgi:CubicO group peptidase (beta-lactamase class C family)